MSVRGHHKRRSLTVNTDLKLMPLMNIIISLIPMLLLSAVFIEMMMFMSGMRFRSVLTVSDLRLWCPRTDMAQFVPPCGPSGWREEAVPEEARAGTGPTRPRTAGEA